jgi:metal-responsive CopG/Arc/MetJ family transcriptional regulator
VPHRIASTKIPEALLEAVDEAARQRGLTRNSFMRRTLEAATDGTLELQSDDARTRDLFQASLRADTELLRQALGTTPKD